MEMCDICGIIRTRPKPTGASYYLMTILALVQMTLEAKNKCTRGDVFILTFTENVL